MSTTAVVVVARRGVERLRAGHPWIYRSDVHAVEAAPGALVEMQTERGRPLGWALWSSTSQIALRAVGADLDPGDEAGWLAARLTAAVAYRETLDLDASAWRVVHAEADRLPGLVIDRYGDPSGVYLVVQALCQGMDRRLGLIVDWLQASLAPRGILARHDVKTRALEALDTGVAVLAGEVPDVVHVREGAFTLPTSLRTGQKTGLFLDQRENHAAAARYGRGRALDAFTYHGGFALALAGRAESVLALDSSTAAVNATRLHAAANQLTNVEVREANVFDELRELDVARERFDTLVLDPPAFARTRGALDRAVAGYKEINLRALKLLRPGGHLLTFSCSFHIDDVTLLEIVRAAASDAGAMVVVVEKRMQSRDHPVLVGVPETSYLKGLVLRRVA
ncbi:MAG TPA: class I SAM-dependent rRNA methyltransferase [Vicinamibacterales bacterium]|nr:class I SAM-dependent rRNA methyltransferase [Vicinamibacterales bacterium]